MTFPLKVKLSHRRDKVRSERAREIETAVTQMNWTRRTTRMKNKKLFSLFVTYPTDTEKTQSATWCGFMYKVNGELHKKKE